MALPLMAEKIVLLPDCMSPSNAAFDAWLKQRSAHSGIRDFAEVDELARSIGFALAEDRPMPANNRTLIWRRTVTQEDQP